MCERLKQAVLKTALPARVTWVRIPFPPPTNFRLVKHMATGQLALTHAVCSSKGFEAFGNSGLAFRYCMFITRHERIQIRRFGQMEILARFLGAARRRYSQI